MTGYWNDPDATAAMLRDGWLHTGDVGHLDADGYLYITDRMKDIIIKGAENISPRQIEEALHGHPAVAEVAVVGMPHATLGEEICAVVVLRAGHAASEAELRDHAAKFVNQFRVPTRVVFRAELPKNGVGKVLKRELAAGTGADREFRVNFIPFAHGVRYVRVHRFPISGGESKWNCKPGGRSINKILGSLMAYGLIETLFSRDLFADTDQADHPRWMVDLNDLCRSVKDAKLKDTEFQSKLEDLYKQVNLPDLVKLIDLDRVTNGSEVSRRRVRPAWAPI